MGPSEFFVDFIMNTLEFFIFFTDPLGNPQILARPSGIQTTFTGFPLPLEFPINILNKGFSTFFSGKAQWWADKLLKSFGLN